MDIIEVYKEYYNKIYNNALKLSCYPHNAHDIRKETLLTALIR